MTDIEAKSRFALIKENLAEVLNPEIIENILADGRHPKIYWGASILSGSLGFQAAGV